MKKRTVMQPIDGIKEVLAETQLLVKLFGKSPLKNSQLKRKRITGSQDPRQF